MKPTLRMLLCLSLIALFAVPTVFAATTAKITAVSLEVTCRTNRSKPWGRAKVGTVLPAGAQVRTGKRSTCEIRFSDGSIVRLAPQSDLTISQVASRDLSLGRGKLYASVRKGSGGATVRGGNGVASVKGTSWTNEVTGDGFSTTVIDGEVNVRLSLDGTVTDYSLGPLDQLTPYMDGIRSLLDLPAQSFINQVFQPWYQKIKAGETVSTTAGQLASLEVLADNLQEIAQVINTDVGPQVGTLIVDVQSVHAKTTKAAPMPLAMVWPPPEALLDVPPLALRQPTTPGRLLGKQLLVPEVQAQAFAFWGEGTGQSTAGVRLRQSVAWNDLLLDVGVTGWSDFESGWHTVLSEASVQARPEWGKVTVGRQHFLEGPVNNATLGSLLCFLTADAVRLQPDLGRLQLDLAYLDDVALPREFDQSGWYGRAATNYRGATFGLNGVHYNGIGTGVSVDFSVPAIPGTLDVYGEFGDDQLGNHLETIGSYFPGLYQDHDVDLFIEYAERAGSDSLLSAYAYRQLPDGWTALLRLQHTHDNPLSLGLGAIKQF